MNALPAQLFRGGIYPILDADFLLRRGASLVEESLAFLSTKRPLLQLRAKSMNQASYERLLRQLSPIARQAGVLLFANDHPEAAAAAGCAGVHVGQGDCDVREIRLRFPELLIGLSTHNAAQFSHGLSQEPDYIALGPLFETSSKKNAEPVVGLDALEALAPLAKAAQIPLVTIGGIEEENLPLVAPHAEWVAMISGLYATTLSQIKSRVDGGLAPMHERYQELDNLYQQLRHGSSR